MSRKVLIGPFVAVISTVRVQMEAGVCGSDLAACLIFFISFFFIPSEGILFSRFGKFDFFAFIPVMLPGDSSGWSRLMHQQAPLLLGLLGDSSQTPNVEQEKRMKDDLLSSANIWTGTPLFDVSCPHTLKVGDLLNRSADVWQISWTAVKVVM